MKLNNGKASLLFIIMILTSLATGCGINQSDARQSSFGIAETFFRALMAKNYPKVRELMGEHAGIERHGWDNGYFIHDSTPSEKMKAIWISGAIDEYAIDEIAFTDYTAQGMPLKAARISFTLQEQKHVAIITLEERNDGWLGDHGWYATVTRLDAGYVLGFE
ncbi:MAG: hypothetical protein HZB51_33325 [Chloroflexi bacterium]|nr:hypothetical protein [Chloroflexota bacterium]